MTPYAYEQIANAAAIARKLHSGQFRKDGVTPYIVHPAAVVSRLDYWMVKSAGWLHDTVEDCGATAASLMEMGVDAGVVEIVLAVSQRKGVETYKQYVRRVASSGRMAIAVKLADLDANMQDVGSLPAGEAKGLTQRWQASRATLLGVGADLKGLLRLSE